LGIEALEVRNLLSTMYVDDAWVGLSNGTVVAGGAIIGTDAFGAIQPAINAAASGDEVDVAAGHYAGTLVVNKSVQLKGEGSALVTIDVTAGAATYGINVTSADVGLSGFTVVGSTSNATLRYGVNVNGSSDITIDDVNVTSTSRSGMNFNGTTDLSISRVQVQGTLGAGLFFSDVKGATLTDIATSDNSWGGMGFSTLGRYFPVGVSGVVLQGTNSFGESNSDNGGIYLEESNWNPVTDTYDSAHPVPITVSTNAADGADVTITSDDFHQMLSGPQDDEWPVRRRLYETLAQAESAAAGSPTHYLANDRVIASLGDFSTPRTFHVESFPGNPMSIQAAIDAADSGDTIVVGAGTYAENLTIDKWINLDGAGDGSDPLTDTLIQPSTGNAIDFQAGGPTAADPLVVSGLRVASGTNGLYFNTAVSHLAIDHVAVSGTSVGVEVHNTAVVGDLTMRDVNISGNGTGLRVATSGSMNHLTIVDSHFDGNSNIGLYTSASSSSATNQDDFTAVTITNTTFDDNTLKGIYVEKLDHATLNGISVRNSGTAGVSSAGIDINLKYGDYHDIAIADSIITGNGSGDPISGWGLAIKARDDGSYSADPATLDGVSIAGNVISGNQQGLLIGADPTSAGPTNVGAHFNRITDDNGTSLSVSMDPTAAALVDAANNWWGSNDGPGGAAVGGGIVAPYLVLSLSTGTSSTVVGGQNPVSADLTHNSAGLDTSSLGSVPDGPIAFGATLGAVDPVTTMLTDGHASTTFTAGAAAGAANLTASFDGGTVSRTLDVVDPALSISGPSTTDEGAAYTLQLNAGPDAGTVSQWSIDWGDGIVETIPGNPPSATHVYLGGPSHATITAVATNALGTYPAAGAIEVDVLNVAPTVVITGVPASVNQGTTVTLGSDVTAPGADVASYSWTVSRDGIVVATGTAPDLSFTPTIVGDYLVTLAVADKDGGIGQQSVSITVLNVAPTVAVSDPPTDAQTGDVVAFQADASDPNPGAMLSYSWSVTREGDVIAVGDQPAIQFTPLLSGHYVVTLTVSDGEGGSTVATTSFDVATAIPPAVEGAVQIVQQRLDQIVSRQNDRIDALIARFDGDPPPFVQRVIQQVQRQQVRRQNILELRVARLQRFFARRQNG
jgi:hypothetical protein